MSSPQRQFNVAVLGAAGGIGQPCSLLMAQSPFVKSLSLYDVVPVVAGVAVDISHIETGVEVKGFAGDFKDKVVSKTQLHLALAGADVVIIPAGVPRKPGMTRDDLFAINAGIVSDLIEGVAEVCPKAMVCIISNPVNSTVPIAAEILKKAGKYDAKRLFGVSTLDVVRSNKFIAQELNKAPEDLDVIVIGGHSGTTILPLLSHFSELSAERVAALTTRIQNAGTEVVEAKAGGGSATLSMAFAGARFANALLNAMSGTVGVAECTYVESSLVPGLDFFASKVVLGTGGVETIQPFGKLSAFEQEQLDKEVIPNLKNAIEKGQKFVAERK